MKQKELIKKRLKSLTNFYIPTMRLIELAKKWNKHENELIVWIADGKMEAYCWCECELKVNYHGIQIRVPPPVNNWVKPVGEELLPLQSKKSVVLRHVIPWGENLSRTVTLNEGLNISIDELVVMEREVERMEREYPELVEQKEEIEQHDTHPLHHTDAGDEKEILLKIVLGMATSEAYNYNPKAKYSTITNEIVKNVAEQNLSISDDTVRRGLKDSASLKKNYDHHGSPTKLSRKSLLKMICGMSVSGYGYDHEEKEKSPIPSDIVADVIKQDLLINEDDVRTYLEEAANLEKDPP